MKDQADSLTKIFGVAMFVIAIGLTLSSIAGIPVPVTLIVMTILIFLLAPGAIQ